MNRNIIYILGLFEDQENSLFQYIQEELFPDIKCHYLAPFCIEKFGTQSFYKITQQVQEFIDIKKPDMIVAHSLGVYITMHISTNKPLILLDPSLQISDVIYPNIKKYNNIYFYDDGTHRTKLSKEFIKSLKNTLDIEQLAGKINAQEVHIFGADKGGYRVTEQYHQHIPYSHYKILPNTTHEFTNKKSRRQILSTIKKRLNIKSSR